MLSISTNVTVKNIEIFIDTLTTCIMDQNKQLELKEKILNNKLPIVTDKVTINDSKIHGKGVFSKVNISKGDIITMYPVDVLILTKDKLEYKIEKSFVNKISDPMLYKEYLTALNENYSIIGYPKELNSSYLGHMCNDGAKGHYNLSHSDIEALNKDKKLYDIISTHKMNAEIILIKDCVVALIAIKDININNEIFLSYGYEKWSMING
jgi:translation initiation factor IF-1